MTRTSPSLLTAHSILSIAAAALLAASASASESGGPIEEDPAKAHANTDYNGDGKVDRHEFSMRVVDVFYFADADRDGHLAPAEFVTTNMGPFPAEAAGDDSSLSLYEFTDECHTRFRTADTDRDGTLSVEEVRVQRERVTR